MTVKLLLERCVRLVCFVFLLASSVYGLITYVPFTYEQFVKPQLIGWITTFAEIHAYLYAIAVVALAGAMRDALVRPGVRWIARGLFACQLGLAAFFLVHPVLAALGNDAGSFAWSVLFLVQLAALGALDVADCRGRLRFAPTVAGRDWTVFVAAGATALFVSLLYFGIALARTQGQPAPGPGGELLAFAWSLLSHLVVFFALATAFVLIIALARLWRAPARTELVLAALVLSGVVFVAVRDIVLASISLTGPSADLYAALAAVAIVTSLAGVALQGFARRGEPVEDGLATLLTPLTLRPASSLGAQVGVLLLLAGAVWLVAARVALYDWNYLVQKLAAGTVWCLAFALFYASARSYQPRPGWSAGVLGSAVLALFAFRALQEAPSRVPVLLGGSAADASSALARHAGHDASFKLLYDVLAPRVADASSSDSFYRFLQDNTNIPRAVKVDPVEIDLVDDLAATSGPKPNIFVLVIDSLRRDYLGVYDDEVRFTPEIDAFARESIVMENAFTRYGATGLSEPSIWVGGLLLHKQYIEPFYPMNTLEKLLEVEGYQTYLSLDTILTTILRPSTSIVELDEGVLNRDYDTCHSLRDLVTKLQDREDRTRPVFAYTQPQNLHVSQITRQGSSVPEGESFPGFHAPYATRVKDVDRCFGAFIDALKAQGLYDESIVILTSDHGESLGEEGRWGHAYTMYPEIVRIPLIVHLPPAMRAGLTWDTGEVAFLTDITPSLYYLLGQRPVRTDPILGRPLFVEKDDESVAREPARDEYLLASSYGPVYAILADRGRSLYIADGVNYRDHLYALEAGKKAEARPVTARIKAEREQQIREQIGEVNRFYRFGDGAAAAP